MSHASKLCRGRTFAIGCLSTTRSNSVRVRPNHSFTLQTRSLASTPGSINHNPAGGLKASYAIAAVVLAGVGGFLLGRGEPDAGPSKAKLQYKYGNRAALESAKQELLATFDKQRDGSSLDSGPLVLDSPPTLESYGFSANSYHPASPHSIVVKVSSTEDVVQVIKIARKYKIPVTPYSGGTSLEGHFGGFSDKLGGICIDLSGMNKVIQINENDGDMIVQSGITWEDVNKTLAERGIPLFFPLDPGPGATIGGMVGTGCSGTNAVRYGTAKGEWFLNLTVVLPDGNVIKTRRRARKSSAGFDTTKLFVGAEGTLGIVTEATLRLAPKLPTSVAVAQFPDVASAVSAVTEVLNSDMYSHIQCVELLDVNMMEAINQAGQSNKSFSSTDSLFFKFQGSPSSIAETSKVVKEIVKRHGSSRFEFARNDKEAEDLWKHRKVALWSTMEWANNLRDQNDSKDSEDSGVRIWTTDVCVPPSKLPQLVADTKRDIDEHKIIACVLGHVGDGNFHALLAFRNDQELEVVKGAVHRMIHRALELDGTCTGEHGVGIGKKDYLAEELGEGTVELMRKIKQAVDPDNLFNPGKLYPDSNVNPSH